MKISDLVTITNFAKSVVLALIVIGLLFVLYNSNWNIKAALLKLFHIGNTDNVEN